MPKRGGLGRGLDALIPPERKKQKASKTDENEKRRAEWRRKG